MSVQTKQSPASPPAIQPSRSKSFPALKHRIASNCVPSIEAVFVDAARWNALLDGFEDASFDQTATFAAGLWGKDRTSFLAVARDGEILGGACAARIALPLASTGLAYIKHGPVWRRRNKTARPEDYDAILSAVIAEYAERHGYGIIVVPRPSPYANPLEAVVLGERGFGIRRPGIDPHRFLVDVTLDEKAQWDSLKQKWRYNLRTALNNEIEVAEVVGADQFQTFVSLHAAMVERKRYADGDPIDLVPTMMAELPARLRPHVFVARHRGRAVAGAVVGVHGDTAYYLFGASNEQALPLKVGYALQWSIIRWLGGKSAKWYDLGGEAGESGLRQFKNGLVGRRGVIVTTAGEYEYIPGLRAQFATDMVMGIRGLRRAVFRGLARFGLQ